MSKSRKKPYTKSKAVDKSCRCNGSCPFCKSNRSYKNAKRLAKSKESYGNDDTTDTTETKES